MIEQARGMGELENPSEEREEYFDVLEHGYASERCEELIEIREYRCPKCNRLLFEGSIDVDGVIFIKCRRCRRERRIKTEPTVKRIGFV